MLGGIYSEGKCPLCGGAMKDNHRDGVICSIHPKQKATNLVVRFGRKFYKRTIDYDLACRILTGIRFKHDEGTYDPRDYQRSNPLALDKQIDKWFDEKGDTLKASTLNRALRPQVRRIQEYFGSVNVKAVHYAEISDFLRAQKDIGDKSKHDLWWTLHEFYSWLLKRQEIPKLPQFPDKPKFSLRLRKRVAKDVQVQILDEVWRMICSAERLLVPMQSKAGTYP